MFYISTRDSSKFISPKDAFLNPVCDSKGLYVPSFIPTISYNEIKDLNIQEIFTKTLHLYFEPDLTKEDCQKVINNFLSNFKNFEQYSAEENMQIIEEDKQKHENEFFTTEKVNGFTVFKFSSGPTLCERDCEVFYNGEILKFFQEKMDFRKKILHIGDIFTACSVSEFTRQNDLDCHLAFRQQEIDDSIKYYLSQNKTAKILQLEGRKIDLEEIKRDVYKHVSFLNDENLFVLDEVNFAGIIFYISIALYIWKVQKGDVFLLSSSFSNMNMVIGFYLAKKMGLPIRKIIINSYKNPLIDNFFKFHFFEIDRTERATIFDEMFSSLPFSFERLIYFIYDFSSGASIRIMNQVEKNAKYLCNKNIVHACEEFFVSYLIEDYFDINFQVLDLIKFHKFYSSIYTSMCFVGCNKLWQNLNILKEDCFIMDFMAPSRCQKYLSEIASYKISFHKEWEKKIYRVNIDSILMNQTVFLKNII